MGNGQKPQGQQFTALVNGKPTTSYTERDGANVKVTIPVDGEKLSGIHGLPIVGIPDILHTLDNRSKAVLAAEEFAACRCRVEMLKGQLLAEQDRLLELCRQVNDAMDEAIKETTNA